MKFVAAALATVLTIVPCVAQAAPADILARIAAYDDAVISIMKAKGGLSVRADRFEPVVREYYDIPATAAIVIGPKWATTSPEDRAATIKVLTRHSALTLARGFGTFDGQVFAVDPQIITRGTRQVAKVMITSPGKKDVVFYQLHESAAGWKIVDVISDGVSQLALQRAEVASTISSGGTAALVARFNKLDAAPR
jgi:phospholipid transport system substrate-binding protein